MATSNLSLTLGNMSFSAEAENESWLTEQLDKFLELAKSSPQPIAALSSASDAASGRTGEFSASLASHLKSKGGESNQTKRFLVAADWLRLKGNKDLNTAMVTKVLIDNHQKRLGNPSECLNANVSKGLCEKTGDGFYITPDGLKDLGY